MKLYYNDYNTHSASKADDIVTLLTPISEAGYLDGIGMQQHDAWNSPSAGQWRASYNKFAAIADEIAVTELDVNPRHWDPETDDDGNLLPVSEERFQQQANQYAMLFKLFLEHSYGSGNGKIVNVTKDGLNDHYAFVADASLWDADNQAKEAYFAVVDIATYYPAMDTLLVYAEQFEETEHSSDSWENFRSARVHANFHFSRDFHFEHSASETIKRMYYNLIEAIEELDYNPTSIADDQTQIAGHIELEQNYPNPFNPTTVIRFSLPETEVVSLNVYNLYGQRVATLADGTFQRGSHEVQFDGAALSSGMYIYRLSTSNTDITRKMTLIK